ncbi:MAG: hypothetical protein AAB557_03515 [Patescibacteria group bacterium]
MVETPTPEEIRKRPLAALIDDIFERRVVTSEAKKERQLIMETYGAKFQAIVDTLPAEKRATTSIVVQKFLVTVGSFFSEYGSRFTDFARNIALWPVVRSSPDFPRDKYYQIELARANAWGTFGRETTKTATAERSGYRDNFLPTALTGSFWGSLIGGTMVGVTEGMKYGLAGGVQGVAIGAGLGAVIGGVAAGISPLMMRLQDRFIGPPVVYYDLDQYSGSGRISINTSTSASLPTRMIPGSPA